MTEPRQFHMIIHFIKENNVVNSTKHPNNIRALLLLSQIIITYKMKNKR